MNNLFHRTLAVIALALCAQYSSQDSTSGANKPKVNFYGVLTDMSNKEYNLENITISGMYEGITVYTKPSYADLSPQHQVKINLANIHEIRTVLVPSTRTTPASAPFTPAIVTFNKREYVEIEVISNDSVKTKSNYIIEKTKNIYGDEGPKGHIDSITDVKSLKINGHKDRDTTPTAQPKQENKPVTPTKTKDFKSAEKQNSAIENLKQQIRDLLAELNSTVHGWFN